MGLMADVCDWTIDRDRRWGKSGFITALLLQCSTEVGHFYEDCTEKCFSESNPLDS